MEHCLGYYFTATDEAGSTARICLPTVTRCHAVSEALRYKGVSCGMVVSIAIHFQRSEEEQDQAVRFLSLVL